MIGIKDSWQDKNGAAQLKIMATNYLISNFEWCKIGSTIIKTGKYLCATRNFTSALLWPRFSWKGSYFIGLYISCYIRLPKVLKIKLMKNSILCHFIKKKQILGGFLSVKYKKMHSFWMHGCVNFYTIFKLIILSTIVSDNLSLKICSKIPKKYR